MAPDPTVPNSILLNGLELSQALPYRVILEVHKTYFAGFFHNMCPEAVNGDASPTNVKSDDSYQSEVWCLKDSACIHS